MGGGGKWGGVEQLSVRALANVAWVRVTCGLSSLVLYSGARFSKVPKLYGPLSGVIITFVFQERRGFKSSNSTVVFLFVALKKDWFFKTSGWQFHKWLLGTFQKRAPALRGFPPCILVFPNL